jgi:uncharacterized protein YutE (UPF0331/DUF86 family)
MDNGAIGQKLQTLDEELTRLRSLEKITAARLADEWQTRRAIERSLQILVEIVVDVCQRLMAQAGQTPGRTGRDAIERCVRLGVLSDAAPYHDMVQFRDLIVHRHEQVDVAILADLMQRRLSDFERFRDEVLAYDREASDGA